MTNKEKDLNRQEKQYCLIEKLIKKIGLELKILKSKNKQLKK